MSSKLRDAFKRLLPARIVRFISRTRTWASRRRFGALGSRELFNYIYENDVWGKDDNDLCSGPGSRGEAASAYVDAVATFVRDKDIRTIVDIGCGDFHIGRKLVSRLGPNIRYVGVDVSSLVIERLTARYRERNIEFSCLDASRDLLPAGELALVRQVLQHLSNNEILGILKRLEPFRYVLITEDRPANVEHFNIDKRHGPDTRQPDQSAIALDKPPFDIGPLEVLLQCSPGANVTWRGHLITWALDRFQNDGEHETPETAERT